MKKLISMTVLAMSGILSSSLVFPATISGKVTKPDGTTPVGNYYVNLYKFDASSGNYNYDTSVYTNATTGIFTAVPSGLGAYLVILPGFDRYSSQAQPFETYYPGNYYPNSNYYYTETYNNVTALTPTTAPTQITITSPTQNVPLSLIKLNPPTAGCAINGPMTINGVAYNYFYSSYGPKLPTTGGTLAISFPVKNFAATSLTTKLQPLAFVSRSDNLVSKNKRSIKLLATEKSVTLAGNATTTVTMSVTVPAALMAATTGKAPALNIGIQTVDTNSVANCLTLQTFPVLNSAWSSATADGAVADKAVSKKTVPLKIAGDGQTVLEWGEIPNADGATKN